MRNSVNCADRREKSKERSNGNRSITNRDESHKRKKEHSKVARLDHHVYQSYLAGILHSSQKSEKFVRLKSLYEALEKAVEINGSECWDRRYGSPLEKKYSKSLSNLSDNVHYSSDSFDEHCDDEMNKKSFIRNYCNSKTKDDGLKNVAGLLKSRIDAFQSEIFSNRFLQCSQKSENSFKRAISFQKLCQKYKMIAERARREKIMKELECRSNRHVERSQSMKLSGTYIRLMEDAARKSRERSLYGYYINETRNVYEKYVENLISHSRSLTNLSCSIEDDFDDFLLTSPPDYKSCENNLCTTNYLDGYNSAQINQEEMR